MCNIKKEDVEKLLKCDITEEAFNEALEYAKRKQKYIYSKENRQVVMQDWYLLQLTYEAVIALAFQNFTMDLCNALTEMEKEHLAHCKDAPTAEPIVTCFAE